YSSFFFFSSRRRHTRFSRNWSSDVCSSDLRHIADAVLHILQFDLPEITVLAADLDESAVTGIPEECGQVIVLPGECIEYVGVVVEFLLGTGNIVFQCQADMVSVVKSKASAKRITQGYFVLVITVIKHILVIHQSRPKTAFHSQIKPPLPLYGRSQKEKQNKRKDISHGILFLTAQNRHYF